MKTTASSPSTTEPEGSNPETTATTTRPTSSYTLTVIVNDGEGGQATITVTVDIQDLDEPPDTPQAPGVTARLQHQPAGKLDRAGKPGKATHR